MIVRAYRCGAAWLAPIRFRALYLATGYRVFDAEPGDPVVSIPTLLSEALATVRAHAPAPLALVSESSPNLPSPAPSTRKKRRGKR